MRYSTRKLESVSDILWMIVDEKNDNNSDPTEQFIIENKVTGNID